MAKDAPIENIRHSFAHLLAAAVLNIYPKAQLAIGPAIDDGFYYDFDNVSIGEDDLPRIEKEMRRLAKQDLAFKKELWTTTKATKHYKKLDQPYKLDLIKELSKGKKTAKVGMVHTGHVFLDLCRGGHIKNTKELPLDAFKLSHVAGAYWRGDEKNPMLTRVYGIAFANKKDLQLYQWQQEEAKKRDHRKLGKELGIYMIDKMVGSGLPIWLPKGTRLRRTLESFLRDEQFERGYQEVITPHIGNIELYKTSGHYPYYSDSQYDPIQVDDEEYMLKPMNCPHHHRIYSNEMRSYRDLPLRLAEFGTVYRYEQSGELSGLSRVRGFTQDDAHIYCMQEQLKQEIKHTIDLTNFVFDTFGMPVDIRLSFRDDNEEKYGGDIELWERAQKEIKEVADEMNLDYTIAPGEASFYGPKIDFIIRDAIGRKWQLGTVQVDYVMPERFDLTYVGSDNEKHRPVIIHRAPFGSMERFTSILIEHFAGNFPLWLSPEQVRVLPISDDQNDYAKKCVDAFKKIGVRVTLDERSEQIGGKIRDAETDKVPYMLIVGAKEQEAGTVSVRRHRKGDIGTFNFSDFLSTVENEIEKKSLPED